MPYNSVSSPSSSNNSPSSSSSSDKLFSEAFVQSQQEQRPVQFSSAFRQAQRLVEHPDLQPQLTFSRIPSGAAGMVIHLMLTSPSFTSQPNSQIDGGDITGWSALFHMRHWYDARFACCKRTFFVHGMVFSVY